MAYAEMLTCEAFGSYMFGHHPCGLQLIRSSWVSMTYESIPQLPRVGLRGVLQIPINVGVFKDMSRDKNYRMINLLVFNLLMIINYNFRS